MNFFAIISILAVLGAVSAFSLTGTSNQTYQEQTRSTNIIRGQFEDDGQTKLEVKNEVVAAKILVRSEQESNYTTLLKIGKGNDLGQGSITLSAMNINESDGRLLYIDQGVSPLDVIITFEPAKSVLTKEDRNRLFTIGYCEEVKRNSSKSGRVKSVVELDLDDIYRNGCISNEGTNMIRVIGYNSFKLKGNNYNVHFTYNQEVFYQIEKEANAEIKNLDLLTKDIGQMSDFSIGNNYITQFQ